MISETDRPPRSRLVARTLLAALLIVGVVACSSKSEAQQASDALQSGLQAQAAGKLDQAATNYKECLKHDQTNKYCLYDLGTIAQTQKSAFAAENYFRLALASDPNFAVAVFNLAILRTQAGAPTEAVTLYRQYVKLMPNDAAGHLNLGLLLNQTGNATEGAAEIAEALRLDPGFSSRLPSPSPTDSPSPSPSSSPSPTDSPSPSPSSSARPSKG